MRRQSSVGARVARRFLPGLALTLASTCALGAAAPLAATAQRQRAGGGAYTGRVQQRVPKPYTGHIHFVLGQGKITGLQFKVGAKCGSLWLVDQDTSVPTFPVKMARTGFSFEGLVGDRLIKLQGTLKGRRIHGTFFQAFPFGRLTCTMGRAASFNAVL